MDTMLKSKANTLVAKSFDQEELNLFMREKPNKVFSKHAEDYLSFKLEFRVCPVSAQ